MYEYVKRRSSRTILNNVSPRNFFYGNVSRKAGQNLNFLFLEKLFSGRSRYIILREIYNYRKVIINPRKRVVYLKSLFIARTHAHIRTHVIISVS